MKRIVTVIVVALACWSGGVFAGIDAFSFKSPQQEARYHRLTQELRCLVCQNESLAASNADLAQDLRREVYHMILDGKSDKEIVDFLVARYGDFVLYRPPVKNTTYLLWGGPLLLFIVGAVVLVVLVRRWGAARQDSELSEEEQARLDGLLKDEKGDAR